MCYGHWMQCSFMSGPPAFGRKAAGHQEKKAVYTEKPLYEIPAKCTKPPSHMDADYAFRIHQFELPTGGVNSILSAGSEFLEAEDDPKRPSGHREATALDDEKNERGSKGPDDEEGATSSANGGSNSNKPSAQLFGRDGNLLPAHLYVRREMVLEAKGVIFGSATDLEGQILNKHPSVSRQHCALLHKDGKLFLKGIDGVTKVWSMTEWKHLIEPMKTAKGAERMVMYENSSNFVRCDLTGVDKLRKVTKNACCFQLGDSPTVYFVESKSLPLGDDEHQKGMAGLDGRRRGEQVRDHRERDRERDRDRERGADRSRERDRRDDRRDARDDRGRDRRR
mmetsp:Transcript_10984/g.26910  ORF Transcript_10984/g.26910 Transcript_10984/m.26910 type:complete len:337 (+) Transcript_10984:136-1146(+)|eukprot:CAMPEP_0178992962 /NCGR_PEP_ID=MMETSP0795-20121207/6421_1 /TAXON_ID=88552 /ORGANISM="Amoebophrya sp., Strain Ameob2" /LENGTH=336 /DNA_ID=CAMNT_0020684933 /DNA_START=53 /DNA_END=1063 /DNA_ORIENTATION=-